MTIKPNEPHILRRFLHSLHMFGFLSLPNFYQDPRKTQWHRYYSNVVVTTLFLHNVSTTSALFVYCVHDLGDFFEKVFEGLACVICAVDVFYLRWNLAQFLALLDSFEEFALRHARNPTLVSLKRREKNVLRLVRVVMALSVIGLNLLPLLPKSPQELARLQRIYKHKYPQNTFSVPLYIPYIDTSEPTVYAILYVLTAFCGFLYYSTLTMTAVVFSFLVFDLKAYAEEHRDPQGRLIFYTNLVQNEYILRDIGNYVDPNDDSSDDFNMREEIKAIRYVFVHNPQLDDYYVSSLSIRAPIGLLMILTSMYGSLAHELLSTPKRIKTGCECIILLCAYFGYFFCGEMLVLCHVGSATWFSHWHKCSLRTKRGLLMLMRISQKIKDMTLFPPLKLRYNVMLSVFRASYSFFHLMNIRRAIK
ncbi:hypothetical protein M8J75_007385 [Diaphorina citri]|nr:hypothetical protein M8J75_007385 [Diaphorina citri]